MKKFFLFMCSFFATACVFAQGSTYFKNISAPKKIIVYYSLTETTARLAEKIASETDADLFRLECKVPYSNGMSEAGSQSKSDKENGVHRELLAVPDLSSYDVVFVGTPVWFSGTANPVETWLLSADLQGKKVVPFCTYWSSGKNETLNEIAELSGGAEILEGIGQAYSQSADVSGWLKKIGMK